MLKVLVILLLMSGIAYADIVQQNIEVDENYKATGETFFMCNLKTAAPDTELPLVKDCIFERCNLYGAIVDVSNVLIQSNVIDTTAVPHEPPIEEQLAKKTARVEQLEKYIGDNSLPIPKEVAP